MGTKYPFGESPVYPPRDWTCPVCFKYHSKPHFAFPDQIDYSKKPQEVGRVKFNREGSQMSCDEPKKYDTPVKVFPQATGDMKDEDGLQHPLFCPHCGWEEGIIQIIKVKSRRGIIWP